MQHLRKSWLTLLNSFFHKFNLGMNLFNVIFQWAFWWHFTATNFTRKLATVPMFNNKMLPFPGARGKWFVTIVTWPPLLCFDRLIGMVLSRVSWQTHFFEANAGTLWTNIFFQIRINWWKSTVNVTVMSDQVTGIRVSEGMSCKESAIFFTIISDILHIISCFQLKCLV